MAALNGIFKRDELPVARRLDLIHTMDSVLGLNLIETARNSLEQNLDDEFTAEERAEIAGKIEQRNLARKAKNFAVSDSIRDELAARGIILKDGATGTTFSRQ